MSSESRTAVTGLTGETHPDEVLPAETRTDHVNAGAQRRAEDTESAEPQLAPEHEPLDLEAMTGSQIYENLRSRTTGGLESLFAEGKLTAEGKGFAKFLYAGINFGEMHTVAQKVDELKVYREHMKETFSRGEGGSRNEILFLHRVISSMETQIRNNAAAGILEEIRASQDSGFGNASARIKAEYDAQEVARVKHENFINAQTGANMIKPSFKHQSIYDRAMAMSIYAHRRKAYAILSEQLLKDEKSGEDIYGIALRVAEHERILALAKSPITNAKQFVDEVYGNTGEEESHPDKPSERFVTSVRGFAAKIHQRQKHAEAQIAKQPRRFSKLLGPRLKRFALMGAVAGGLLFSMFFGLRGSTVSASEIAQAPAPVYQEYSRHVGFEPQMKSQLEWKTITRTETIRMQRVVEETTEMANIKKLQQKDCLTTVVSANGISFLTYGGDSADNEACKTAFPTAAQLNKTVFFSATQPIESPTPEFKNQGPRIPFMDHWDQQGETCAATTLISILNTFLKMQGRAMIHPFIIADAIAAPVTEKQDDLATPTPLQGFTPSGSFFNSKITRQPTPSETVNAMNNFKIDAVGLRNEFNVDVQNLYMHEGELMGNALYNLAQTEIAQGHIIATGVQVNEHARHKIAIVGTFTNDQGNKFIVAYEPNGGYTGWEYTMNKWTRDQAPYVNIPIEWFDQYGLHEGKNQKDPTYEHIGESFGLAEYRLPQMEVTESTRTIVTNVPDVTISFDFAQPDAPFVAQGVSVENTKTSQTLQLNQAASRPTEQQIRNGRADISPSQSFSTPGTVVRRG